MSFSIKSALRSLAQFNGQSGTCWDDPSNLDRLNDARALIYESGDYEGTVAWVVANVGPQGNFCAPIGLAAVRSIYHCDKPIEIMRSPSILLSCDDAKKCCRSGRVVSARKSPDTRPYCCKPDSAFGILVESDSVDDDGAEIAITHVTQNRQIGSRIAKLKRESRVKIDGLFSDIVRISKERTFGTITVYAEVEDSDCMVIAEIPPGIEFPQYQHFVIEGACKSSQVVLMGKASCLPIVLPIREGRLSGNMMQAVDIQSLNALKFAYQALNKQESGDTDEYTKMLTAMTRHLGLADQNIEDFDSASDIGDMFQHSFAGKASVN